MSSSRKGVYRPQTWLGQSLSQLSDDQRRWVYVVALVFAVSLLSFVHLAQTGYVVRQIEEMEVLEAKLLETKQANNSYRLQIAEHEQWLHVRQLARALGFTKPGHVEYVEVLIADASVPSPEGSLTHEEASSPPVVALDSPGWWSELARQLGAWIQGGRPRGPETDTEAPGKVQ